MGFIGLGLVIALIVLLFLWDRRSKKNGHRFRSSSDMTTSIRDVDRNVRASRETGFNPVDKDWNKPDDQRYPH